MVSNVYIRGVQLRNFWIRKHFDFLAQRLGNIKTIMSKLICLKDFLHTISAKVIALKPRNTLTAPSTTYVLQIFIFGIETCAIVILQNIKLKKIAFYNVIYTYQFAIEENILQSKYFRKIELQKSRIKFILTSKSICLYIS